MANRTPCMPDIAMPAAVDELREYAAPVDAVKRLEAKFTGSWAKPATGVAASLANRTLADFPLLRTSRIMFPLARQASKATIRANATTSSVG